mgnify:CR=1 FL=1|jgi:hypothetical protein|tara:strand:- start:663 stop:920 length:258 start_codon:yes stop_codon:yes gene_type:complete
MIDMEWLDNDMGKGLKLVQRNPFTTTMELDWKEVDSLISLAIAYRELKSSRERLGLSIRALFKDNTQVEEGSVAIEDGENYGGTK